MVGTDYGVNKVFEEEMLPIAMGILEREGLGGDAEVAPLEEDMRYCADLKVAGLSIAVRFRRPEAIRYWGDITIRLNHANGAPSEYPKLMAGHGDLMLYVILNEEGQDEPVYSYVLIDLDRWRALEQKNRLLKKTMCNYDVGPSEFYVYSIAEVRRRDRRAVLAWERPGVPWHKWDLGRKPKQVLCQVIDV